MQPLTLFTSLRRISQRPLVVLRLKYLGGAFVLNVSSAFVVVPWLVGSPDSIILSAVKTVGVTTAGLGIMLVTGHLIEKAWHPITSARIQQEAETLLRSPKGE